MERLQDDIRAGMAHLEIVAGEARRERRTYLTHEFAPDPLVRTVLRLRNDVVMIGRAAAELPDRATHGRDRVVDIGRATRAPAIGVLSHFGNYAWLLRRPRRLTCAVAGACAWAGD